MKYLIGSSLPIFLKSKFLNFIICWNNFSLCNRTIPSFVFGIIWKSWRFLLISASLSLTSSLLPVFDCLSYSQYGSPTGYCIVSECYSAMTTKTRSWTISAYGIKKLSCISSIHAKSYEFSPYLPTMSKAVFSLLVTPSTKFVETNKISLMRLAVS